MAPLKKEDEYISGSDDFSFRLDDLKGFKVSDAITKRGQEYYMENKVVYICLDGTRGYAIVEGGRPYEVEFTYASGDISGLVCSCFYSHNCKHKVAAMLQLRETLELIEKNYAEEYKEAGYFAAASKGVLFSIALDGKETGTFTL